MTNRDVFLVLKKLGEGAPKSVTTKVPGGDKTDKARYLSQNDLLNMPEVLKHDKIGKLAGMCDALCHDWIRRVLQGGGMAFGSDGPSPNEDPKLKKAAIRSGYGQQNVIYAKNDSHNLFIHAYNKYINLNSNSTVTLDVETERALVMSRYLTKDPKGQRQYNCGILKEAITKASDNKLLPSQLAWNKRAKMWDEFWTNVRGNKSSHPFSRITLVQRKPFSTYASVYDGVKDAILQLSQGNRAAILGFHTDDKGTDGGHAVALHRTNAGEYRFFDPNFGSFEYKTYALAATAVIFVVQYAYIDFKWEPMRPGGKFDMDLNVFVAMGTGKVPNDTLPLFSEKEKDRINKLAAAAKLLVKSTGVGQVN